MATNLLLEGDDLEALLARAADEGGPTARIVRAEKVRRGGVLGFFAREGFEVAVEIPDAHGPGGSVAAAATAASVAAATATVDGDGPLSHAALKALAARIEAAEQASAVTLRARPEPGGAERTAFRPGVAASPDTLGSGPAAAAALVAALGAARADGDRTLDLATTSGSGSSGSGSSGSAERPPAPRRLFPYSEEPEYSGTPRRLFPGSEEPASAVVARALAVLDGTDDLVVTTDPDDAQPAARRATSLAERLAAQDLADGFEPSTRTAPAGTPSIDTDAIDTYEPDTYTAEPTDLDGSAGPEFTTLLDTLRAEGRVTVSAGRKGGAATTPFAGPGALPGTTILPGGVPAQPARGGDAATAWAIPSGLVPGGVRAAAVYAEVALPVTSVGPEGPDDVDPPSGDSGAGEPADEPIEEPADEPTDDVADVVVDDVVVDDVVVDDVVVDDVVVDDAADETDAIADETDSTEVADDAADEGATEVADVAPSVDDDLIDAAVDVEPAPAAPIAEPVAVPALAPEPVAVPALALAPEPEPVTTTDLGEPVGAEELAALLGVHDTVPARTRRPVDTRLAADRRVLRGLGVPGAWTRRLKAGDRFSSVMAMLSAMPELEADADVPVVAVVGLPGSVVIEAHRVAVDLAIGSRPRRVVVVPTDDAPQRDAALDKAMEVDDFVAAVETLALDSAHAARVRTTLRQLRAALVIAVVDASRPLQETKAWLSAIGPVDALAVDGATEAADPAASLKLDLPVIRLDGIPVDRVTWTALLCAQLDLAERAR